MLINPPGIFAKESMKPTIYLPIGILSVTASLDKAGYDVEVHDAKISAGVHPFGNHFLFGDSFGAVEEKIRESRPDIVGIGCPFTILTPVVLEIARRAKNINPKIIVVVGGPSPTVKPTDFTDNIDFVIRGEGEIAMVELLDAIGRGETPDRIITAPPIENLDALHFPDYSKVPMEKYLGGGFAARSEFTSRAVPIFTSRGCPYSCCFCSVRLSMGQKWRAHSADYVRRHLELLKEKYGVRLVHIEDDNSLVDCGRFGNIIKSLGELNIKWDTPNGVRADLLDEALLVKMKKSGCQYVILAPESGVQRVVTDVIGKNLNLKKVEDAAAVCKKIRLDCEAFFVIGLIGETLEDIGRTFKYAKYLHRKYNVSPQFNIACPLYGTRLYEDGIKDGNFVVPVTPENLLTVHQGRSIIKTPDFSPDDIARLFKKHRLFILWTRARKALRHPHVLKSYLRKRLLAAFPRKKAHHNI